MNPPTHTHSLSPPSSPPPPPTYIYSQCKEEKATGTGKDASFSVECDVWWLLVCVAGLPAHWCGLEKGTGIDLGWTHLHAGRLLPLWVCRQRKGCDAPPAYTQFIISPHPPPPFIGGWGLVLLSLCPSVVLSAYPIVSAQYFLNRSTIFFSNFGMVVYYHEAISHAKKLVHHLQCQGHSKSLYNQNKTIFTISSKLPVRLQSNLVW